MLLYDAIPGLVWLAVCGNVVEGISALWQRWSVGSDWPTRVMPLILREGLHNTRRKLKPRL